MDLRVQAVPPPQPRIVDEPLNEQAGTPEHSEASHHPPSKGSWCEEQVRGQNRQQPHHDQHQADEEGVHPEDLAIQERQSGEFLASLEPPGEGQVGKREHDGAYPGHFQMHGRTHARLSNTKVRTKGVCHSTSRTLRPAPWKVASQAARLRKWKTPGP